MVLHDGKLVKEGTEAKGISFTIAGDTKEQRDKGVWKAIAFDKPYDFKIENSKLLYKKYDENEYKEISPKDEELCKTLIRCFRMIAKSYICEESSK